MSQASVQLKPTATILGICDLLNAAIGNFLKARSTVPPLSKWESEGEARNLFNLVIRDIESTLELAKTDLVLLPGANVLARAVFEISLKAAWMVAPDAPFQREARWLAHLQAEVRMHDQIAQHIDRFGGNPKAFKVRAEPLRNLQMAVAKALPEGYSVPRRDPTIEQMLEAVGQEQIYPVYRLLSGFVHGTHASTWLYRRNLGTLREYGEFISTRDWYLPLWSNWKCLQILGQFVLERMGADKSGFLSQDQCDLIDDAFSALSDSGGRQPSPPMIQ